MSNTQIESIGFAIDSIIRRAKAGVVLPPSYEADQAKLGSTLIKVSKDKLKVITTGKFSVDAVRATILSKTNYEEIITCLFYLTQTGWTGKRDAKMIVEITTSAGKSEKDILAPLIAISAKHDDKASFKPEDFTINRGIRAMGKEIAAYYGTQTEGPFGLPCNEPFNQYHFYYGGLHECSTFSQVSGHFLGMIMATKKRGVTGGSNRTGIQEEFFYGYFRRLPAKSGADTLRFILLATYNKKGSGTIEEFKNYFKMLVNAEKATPEHWKKACDMADGDTLARVAALGWEVFSYVPLSCRGKANLVALNKAIDEVQNNTPPEVVKPSKDISDKIKQKIALAATLQGELSSLMEKAKVETDSEKKVKLEKKVAKTEASLAAIFENVN